MKINRIAFILLLLLALPALGGGAKPVTSGGLGLTLSEMMSKYGNSETLGGVTYFKNRVVSWDGQTRMEYSYQNAGATATLSQAKKQAKVFIPTDAKLTREAAQSSPYPRTVQFYQSSWLARKVSSKSAWGSAKPGTFIVIYRRADGPVTSFVASCGDNP